MIATNDWGTVQEAAAILGVSTKTIRRRITDGGIAAKRFGPRLIRVYLPSIEQSGRSLQYRSGEDR